MYVYVHVWCMYAIMYACRTNAHVHIAVCADVQLDA